MHVYVEAMARVLKEIPDCKGVIVGGKHHLEPDYADWLAEKVQALGVSKEVRMVDPAQRAGMDAGDGCGSARLGTRTVRNRCC